MLTVSLLTLGDPGRMTGGYLYHRRIAEAAGRHDARILFTSFPIRPFPLSAAAGRGVLRQSLAARPDVLLLDSIAAAFTAPWLSSHGLELPLAAIIHQPPGGIDHGWARTRLQAPLDRLAYRKAARLLVASEALAAEFVASGLAEERVRVVPPGRDVAGVIAAPRLDLREGRRAALLTVGNWVARKDLLTLLDAFARLNEDLATLHLVGDDRVDPAYARRVRARLSQPDLAGRIRVHGPRSRQEVARLYGSADIFVLTSRVEPYGTVYGEAMAAGLPVVGWRAGNLPHLARDGREGLMPAPGDVEGLAGALARLAADKPFRQALGQAARRRAETFPTWEETASLLFAELRDIAGDR